MCDIAPLQMTCKNEKYKDRLTSCAVHHLYQAFSNLFQSLPIVRAIVSEYHCPEYKPKVEVAE